MNTALKYKELKEKEAIAAHFIPYSSHVTQNIIKLMSGDYVATIRLQGAAHESADSKNINDWHEQLNGFMKNIASPQIAVWTHVVRREYDEYPEGDYKKGFSQTLNEKYKNKMSAQKMLINELYVSIIYRPAHIVEKLFKLFGTAKESVQQQKQHEEIEKLNDYIATALASLNRYEPELLGCYEHHNNMFSEILEFFSFLVNGEWDRFPLPRNPINQVLSRSRQVFGNAGTMLIKTATKIHYYGIVAFHEYPPETSPGILNSLLSMPFKFVLSQSFTFLSKNVAVERMKQQQNRMINAGDVAVSQVEEISNAMDDLVSTRFVMGVHSISLNINADSEKELTEYITIAGKELSDKSINWIRTDLNMAAAYWAQLPGNFEYRINRGDISSRNFAAFSSLHNYPIGHIRSNQWGSAVTMFQTSSGAPYYFNFHKSEDGAEAKRAATLDKNHKNLANTIFIGISGSGKTVLETFLLSQVQKFNRPENGKPLTCVLFDKDLGASVAVRAMGGTYYPLRNGLPSGFNPFHLEPTPNNLSFLEKLVKQLVKNETLPITPAQEKAINEAIKGVMSIPKVNRRLGSLLEFFDSTDQTGIHIRLSRWCEKGALGWLFDNENDILKIDDCPIVGFDVTEFLDNAETRTPTIMYLFHRIETLIDGRRIPIFMDEFWKLLNDPAFEDLAQNKLVTIRKQDGFLVMFTQYPEQVLSSTIATAIVSQTATKVFLPNPDAKYDEYVTGFNLTEREYEIVRTLPENSRRFLIKQGQNSVVAELNLKGFDDELAVLSGNTQTSNMVEKLIIEIGDNPDDWLPEFHRRRKLAF